MAPDPRDRWTVPIFGFMVVAWGINYLVVRALLPFGGPLWLAALRAGLGGLVALLFLLDPRVRGHLSGAQRRNALLLGFVNTGGMYGLWFLAAAQAGETAVLIYTFPLQVALLGLLFQERRPDLVGSLALGGGFLGVFLVTEPWTQIRLAPLAVGALLLAALSWGLGTVAFKRYFRPEELVEANPYQLLGGAALLTGLAIVFESSAIPVPNPTFWVEALYLGVFGTALAYGAWFYLLGRQSAKTLSTYTLLVPVIALTLSVGLVNERIDAVQLFGIGLVLVSLAALGRSRLVAAVP